MNFKDLPDDIHHSIMGFLTYSDALPCYREWPMDYCIPCLHGWIIELYKNGKISELCYWKHDKRHGVSISYYENGVMASMSNWKYGQLHGKWQQWDIESNLTVETYFNNGMVEKNIKII